ncbi:hypothetical protein FW774_01715 (plasmid) [Pedobacter sp. BS3]|uniref:hypothetical protein n=1 Tax=Pedobacter sp. BS3 TaxID=2567937 RepID=UPI0011ED293A|nr:hypothetical protein [Pedobacter sp. BS3]TZF85814.1 hypothetical protein FW774_01715 [Pedobacter sp. BS3]
MPKYIFSTIISLLIGLNSLNAQIIEIKKKISEIFFDFNLSPEKFDIKRNYDRSDNFYDYDEIKFGDQDDVTFKFEEHPLLNFLGKKNEITIIFKPSGAFDQLIILSHYPASEIGKCEAQIQQILSYFNKLCYKVKSSISQNGQKKLVGRGYFFYSSLNQSKTFKPFLNISCDIDRYGGYVLDIHYFPSFLK